ncbi:MAG: DUF3090 family protein [Actinomycetota bacterium]
MELDPVDRITADAVGEPGARTFYLQARKGPELLTVILEKEQVRLLAASILEILQRVGIETDPVAIPEERLALEEPLEPDWRAGRLSIGYQEERDLMVLDVEELLAGEEDDEAEATAEIEPTVTAEDDDERIPEEARLWASREQMLALARHGAEVVGAGRPICQFCGHPKEPEGHWCPATNGHREIGSV